MKILAIHAEEFEYEARQRAPGFSEEVPEEKRRGSLRNGLVCFITVEKCDEANEAKAALKAADDLVELAERLGVDKVLLYPYAHLSDELAKPESAIRVLDMLARELSSRGLKVERAPFGWYKRFYIKCLGHPLAESLRVIRPVEAKRAYPDYAVLMPSGEVVAIEELKLDQLPKDFRILVEREVLKKEGPGGKPRYLAYCRKFGFEWESMSDLGHMRYGPEAAIMMDLAGEYAWMCAKDLGVPLLRVKGTNMFNLEYEPIKEHANLFGERMYSLEVDDKKMILRFAACHQQFAMIKDWNISYKHLPFGVFELADSYRLEQPGELVLCFRMRRFYMPDLHIFCRSLSEAMEMAIKVHEKIYEEIRKLGRDYVSIYNITRSFFNSNRDFVLRLVKTEKKPVLLHFVPEGKYYWVINVEYNIIDELERPREIGTFQIDIGNAKRFGITYVDENGEKKYPVIIHTAIIGSLERYIYAVFDTAAKAEASGGVPMIPTWLAPVQVRFIPYSREQLDYVLKLAEELNALGFRADVDDREESVAKRVRDAEVKWIPYIVVVGPKEVEKGVLSVRVRKSRTVLQMTFNELKSELESEVKGYPRLSLSIPVLLSRRPGYR